jgi:hypothetical protein
MMKLTATLLVVLISGSLGLAAQDITPEEILRQKKSGVENPVLMERVKSAGKSFDLSADQVVALTAAGVSEEVIQLMLVGPRAGEPAAGKKASSPPPARGAAPQPEPDKPPTRVLFENKTSSSLWAGLDVKRRLFVLSPSKDGTMVEVPKGGIVRFEAPAGDFEARWRGACACFEFKVQDGGTFTLQVIEKRDEEGGLALFLSRGQPPRPAPARNSGALYGCPHHPEVRQKEPGECPKCGMKLEPVPTEPKPNPPREGHDHSRSGDHF